MIVLHRLPKHLPLVPPFADEIGVNAASGEFHYHLNGSDAISRRTFADDSAKCFVVVNVHKYGLAIGQDDDGDTESEKETETK